MVGMERASLEIWHGPRGLNPALIVCRIHVGLPLSDTWRCAYHLHVGLCVVYEWHAHRRQSWGLEVSRPPSDFELGVVGFCLGGRGRVVKYYYMLYNNYYFRHHDHH